MSDQEHWDARYREGNVPWHTEKPSVELASFLDTGRIVSGTAIDLGCGYGTNSIYLARRGLEVVGVDLSPTAIEGARRRAEEEELRVDFRVADLTADPDVGGSFDFLYDRGVYHILRRVDLDAYLRLLLKISHPDSKFLFLTGNANEPCDEGPPKVSEEEIRSELGSVFKILDLHEFRWETTLQRKDRPLGWSVTMERRGD